MRRKIDLLTALVLFLCLTGGIFFQIQVAEARLTITIKSDGSIDPDDGRIELKKDGVTYALTENIERTMLNVQKEGAIIDGEGYTLTGDGEWLGIRIVDLDRVTIRNINIQGFLKGIILQDSGLIQIEKNTITNNLQAGIELSGYSTYNKISENNVIGNGDGIRLKDTTMSTTVYKNIIKENQEGINISNSSNYNSIFNNDFINNVVSVGDFNNEINSWNQSYPTGGNYWSDYTSFYPSIDDSSGPNQNQPGGDEIWDHPYFIYPSEEQADNLAFKFPINTKAFTSINCYVNETSTPTTTTETVHIVGNITPRVGGTAVTVQCGYNEASWDSYFTTTDSDGSYHIDITVTTTVDADYYFKASWEGNDDYYGAESGIKKISVSGPSNDSDDDGWPPDIPGFPWESILLGAFLGLATLYLLHQKKVSASRN